MKAWHYNGIAGPQLLLYTMNDCIYEDIMVLSAAKVTVGTRRTIVYITLL